MKTLVIYYSYSGNTKVAADAIAKTLQADIEELRPVKPLNASGAGYVAWGFVSWSVPVDRH